MSQDGLMDLECIKPKCTCRNLNTVLEAHPAAYVIALAEVFIHIPGLFWH